MLLKALRDIPSSVGPIVKGQMFKEHNPMQAREWIDTGVAEELKTVNSRGWNGLAWDNAEVVIMASGESLSEKQAYAVHAWRGTNPTRKVIVINTSYQRAPWADLLYACDGVWWKHYLAEVRSTFKGSCWTQQQDKAAEYGINLIRSRRSKGLSKDVGWINQGENSGYQAIGLAYWSGAARVYLLGFDLKGGHWHGDHPGTLNKVNRFSQWLKNFELLAQDCAAVGFEVVNCTPQSALKSFPRKDWKDVFI